MKTIEEKNKMIAGFMGKEMYQQHHASFYHSSWDWLMPVVERIELLEYSVEKNFQRVDGDFQCLITKGNDILFQEFANKGIDAMHYVVVEFIEHYNKNI